jgi:uncharacterized protein YbgA (DUF1722 family)/uncharacterized protein YbbK (DUF523 family)
VATRRSRSFQSSARVRIGISSCLLGQKVRYDGGHKRDDYILSVLGEHVEYVPVCPEVAIGLGIPRPPIQLAGDPGAPRAVGVRDPAVDVTDKLYAYGRRTARKLSDISGYILKSKSPSCGMERVKVYPGPGRMPVKQGVGIFARALLETLPNLPVEEEGRLCDPVLRENFIERVFAYQRWQVLRASRMSPAKLVDFHTAHKLSLMAHGPEYYRGLGRLVAQDGTLPIGEVSDRYIEGFMAAMRHRATPKRHANVLMHLMGYLKRELDAEDKAELLEVIDRYRRGRLPLIVPITLIKHHFRRHPHEYVARQVYLDPHPQELMLRNAV